MPLKWTEQVFIQLPLESFQQCQIAQTRQIPVINLKVVGLLGFAGFSPLVERICWHDAPARLQGLAERMFHGRCL
jgi:hypothetical protein